MVFARMARYGQSQMVFGHPNLLRLIDLPRKPRHRIFTGTEPLRCQQGLTQLQITWEALPEGLQEFADQKGDLLTHMVIHPMVISMVSPT